MKYSSSEIAQTGTDYVRAINEFIQHRKKKKDTSKLETKIMQTNIKNQKDIENP